jgi:DNA-directed RNA polymerase subunit RPC12/RpoP
MGSKRNMYGCLPCPRCGSEYRYPMKDGHIYCDDCNTKVRYMERDARFDDWETSDA